SSSSSSPLKGYFEDWWRPRKAHAFDYYDEYNLNPGLEWDEEFTDKPFNLSHCHCFTKKKDELYINSNCVNYYWKKKINFQKQIL
ncbi:hypothetical protein L9F63_022918, partial [Diploptera punctata]